MVFIRARATGHGYGRAIMQQVIRHCAAYGVKTIVVSLQQCLLKAGEFYHRLGFISEKTRKKSREKVQWSLTVTKPPPERVDVNQCFVVEIEPAAWAKYTAKETNLDELMCRGVKMNSQKPQVICVCDYAPAVGCAYGGHHGPGMPAGLPRPRVERVPGDVLDTDFISDTVTTAIDAELLHKHADHTHVVSGASVHAILKQNLGDVWVSAYVGTDVSGAAVLDAAILKRLQGLTQKGSKTQAKLEEHLLAGTRPDVAPLFVGQRVWARWLGTQNKFESGWCATWVLGESERDQRGQRTYHIYFDIDRKEHPKLPMKKSSHLVIRTDDPSV